MDLRGGRIANRLWQQTYFCGPGVLAKAIKEATLEAQCASINFTFAKVRKLYLRHSNSVVVVLTLLSLRRNTSELRIVPRPSFSPRDPRCITPRFVDTLSRPLLCIQCPMLYIISWPA